MSWTSDDVVAFSAVSDIRCLGIMLSDDVPAVSCAWNVFTSNVHTSVDMWLALSRGVCTVSINLVSSTVLPCLLKLSRMSKVF